jgi:DNA topoisomerase-1
MVVDAIAHVSKRLGNTPAVCRKSYIHPEIINAYMEGGLITTELDTALDANTKATETGELTPAERQVLDLLKRRLSQV